MKKLTLLILMIGVAAIRVGYAEPRQTHETKQSARHVGETKIVEHATAVEEMRTDTIQNNQIKSQALQQSQYLNKEGYVTTEYNTDMAQSAVGGAQQQHQQSQTLTNRAMRMQSKRTKLANPGASLPEFKSPKFSSLQNSQMTMSLPKFKAQSFQANTISVNTGQTERQVKSTNSAMSNMQVRYMNKVLEGRIDYAVNEGGRR